MCSKTGAPDSALGEAITFYLKKWDHGRCTGEGSVQGQSVDPAGANEKRGTAKIDGAPLRCTARGLRWRSLDRLLAGTQSGAPEKAGPRNGEWAGNGQDLKKRGPGIGRKRGPVYPGPRPGNGAGQEFSHDPPRPAVRAGAGNFGGAPANPGPRPPRCER